MIRIDTNLPVILAVLRNKLITDRVYNATTVFISDKAELDVPPSDSYCVIVPITQETENPEADLVSGAVEIHVFHRNTLDQKTRSDIQLTESTGMMVKRLAVHRSLHLQDLAISATWILAEPMRLLSFTQPVTENMVGHLTMTFSIKYGLDPFAVLPQLCSDTRSEFDCEWDIEYGDGEGNREFNGAFSSAFG